MIVAMVVAAAVAKSPPPAPVVSVPNVSANQPRRCRACCACRAKKGGPCAAWAAIPTAPAVAAAPLPSPAVSFTGLGAKKDAIRDRFARRRRRRPQAHPGVRVVGFCLVVQYEQQLRRARLTLKIMKGLASARARMWRHRWTSGPLITARDAL